MLEITFLQCLIFEAATHAKSRLEYMSFTDLDRYTGTSSLCQLMFVIQIRPSVYTRKCVWDFLKPPRFYVVVEHCIEGLEKASISLSPSS